MLLLLLFCDDGVDENDDVQRRVPKKVLKAKKYGSTIYHLLPFGGFFLLSKIPPKR
jgi:hypothetical protein